MTRRLIRSETAIDPRRVTASGFAATRPQAINTTAEGKGSKPKSRNNYQAAN